MEARDSSGAGTDKYATRGGVDNASDAPTGADWSAQPAEGRRDAPLTQSELIQIVSDISATYTATPVVDGVTLLDIDPHRLHAYWHLDEAILAAAQKEAGSPYAPVTLRLVDVGSDLAPGAVHDVDVGPAERNRYLAGVPGHAYRAKLGVRKGDGGLIVLGESNVARLPPAGPSDIYHRAALDTRGAPDRAPATAELPAPRQPATPPRSLVPEEIPLPEWLARLLDEDAQLVRHFAARKVPAPFTIDPETLWPNPHQRVFDFTRLDRPPVREIFWEQMVSQLAGAVAPRAPGSMPFVSPSSPAISKGMPESPRRARAS